MKTPFALSRSIRTLAPLALAAALAGCSMAPKYDRPAAPIDTAYPSGGAYVQQAPGTPDAGITADIGWREFFRDPLLQQLIGISLENNRDMRKAALNVEAARALYRIQRAEMLPNLGVSASGVSERLPADLSTTGNGAVLRRYDVAGVTAAWELDLWGRVRSLSDRALASYLALDETRIATQMSLVSEVANAYLTLRADQELLRLTHDTLATQKRSYDLTNQLVEAGNSTQLDLRRAETALRTAEANHAAYTRQAAKDGNALVLLLGKPLTPELSRQLDEAVSLPADLVPADLPSGLPSELLTRRPDIRAAEQMLIGANANIGAARAAFFPTITLTGSAGTASASLDGLFDPGSRAWSFLPQITLPIFRGGALLANLDVSQVQKRIEIANYEKAIQAAFAEVADGLAGKRTLDDQIRSEELLVAASQKAYELAEQRFQEGVDDNLTLLDAQRTLYGTQQTLVRTRLTRLNNLIHLYKALGGGWTERTMQSGATAQQPPRLQVELSRAYSTPPRSRNRKQYRQVLNLNQGASFHEER
ncbi:efflux transporter outer membrane subunit [Cupriavidus sp. AU9028]|uniref:efflux transporter outer membrane subunit n=1 Tax=Cupriavidus sp. AU9028 TaxID=2871157 RepID=UPI001C97A502|nr:efflux transporter outer membrane subunit [Cupriavidus sp. AU9028]MBY4898617.1 efflux transporter outer membrane subunit [Cupriavidus sp. AU9028]